MEYRPRWYQGLGETMRVIDRDFLDSDIHSLPQPGIPQALYPRNLRYKV